LYPSYCLSWQIWSFKNGFKTEPRCKNCGGVLKKIYAETCSYKCSAEKGIREGNYIERNKKSQKTNMERRGVPNPAQCPAVQEKILQTNLTKYGAKVSPNVRESTRKRAREMQAAGKESLLRTHGVTNPGQLPGHREKCKKTTLENYGVEHYALSDEYKARQKIRRFNNANSLSPDTITIIGIHDPDLPKYENPNHRIEFSCSHCGDENTLPFETFKWRCKNIETPCTQCSGVSLGSVAQLHLTEFVQSLGFHVVPNARNIIDSYEIDIHIPALNIGIEYHGLYWHNNSRTEHNYHLNKLQAARKAGIQLIQVFEDEWINKENITKSLISKILDATQEVSLDNWRVSSISAPVANDFLESNHINSYTESTASLGLYNNNKLVAVLQATEHIDGRWEIQRYGELLNQKILRGEETLISHFISEFNPLEITIYSDLRWNVPNSYHDMGFTYDCDLTPTTWIFNGEGLVRRLKLTEDAMSSKKPWLYIDDCGLSKHTWQR